MIGIVVKQTGLASDEDIDGRGGRLVGAVEQQSISAHHHHDSWLLIQLLQTTERKPPLFPNPKTSSTLSFLVFIFPPFFVHGDQFSIVSKCNPTEPRERTLGEDERRR
jgi:hypothetical protein